MNRVRGTRRVEGSAMWALAPIAAMLPFSLLALVVFWYPVHLLTGVSYWVCVLAFGVAGLLLFVRPFQTRVLTPLLGARMADADEAQRVADAWSDVAQASGLPVDRYAVRVLPSDEINAFACGGHLLVVTSRAVNDLDDRQLRGVLAHELGHHLGLHTVAVTIRHWLSLPLVVLAHVGRYLEHVGRAVADTFGEGSALVKMLGLMIAEVFKVVGQVLRVGLDLADRVSTNFSHRSEFEADEHAVDMGYGPELASALRTAKPRRRSVRSRARAQRSATSHPAPQTRVARIEAMTRRSGPRQRSNSRRDRGNGRASQLNQIDG